MLDNTKLSKSEENELMWEQFITESPWHMKNPLSSFDEYMENLNVEEIMQSSVFSKYLNLLIYHNRLDNNESEFYFIDGSKIAAYCRYQKLNDRIILEMIWNSKNSKGLFKELIKNYLLPKFKCVESGETMSDAGFKFFKSLMEQNPELKFYLKYKNHLTKIQSPKDFSNYKEPLHSDNTYSTFVVTL